MVNKSIFLSLLLIGVVAASAGAGTWAAFSDVETSTGNTFTAGTMNLLIDNVEAEAVGHFVVNPTYPGDYCSAEVPITNEGNINGILSLRVVNLVDNENNQNAPEAAVDETAGTYDGELSKKLDVVIVEQLEDGSEESVFSGTLRELRNEGWINLGLLEGPETRNFKLSYSVDENVGNVIQSDSAVFDITVKLEQDMDN